MAYHIYQTEGLVIRSLAEGEASKYVEILTRDLGLVGAHAKTVRAEKSKLRYALQDFSLSHISLVRGKHAWKIINAVADENFFFQFKNDGLRKKALLRIVGLPRKLVHGEEKNKALYETLIQALKSLSLPDLDSERIIDLQLLAALRILHHLGYGVSHKELKRVAEGHEWDNSSLDITQKFRTEAKDLIKKSLSESHL
jgi:DNA repair protein RecO